MGRSWRWRDCEGARKSLTRWRERGTVYERKLIQGDRLQAADFVERAEVGDAVVAADAKPLRRVADDANLPHCKVGYRPEDQEHSAAGSAEFRAARGLICESRRIARHLQKGQKHRVAARNTDLLRPLKAPNQPPG